MEFTEATTIPDNQTLVTSVVNLSFNSSDTFYPRITAKMVNDSKFERLIPAIVYTAVLMIVGTPGNAIVWYVYYARWRRSSTRIFILGLASLDLINCFLTLPVEIYMMFNYVIFEYNIVCKLSRFTTYVCNSSAALILIAIAVDRYQRICKPHHNVMRPRTAKLVCWLAVTIALLTTWPSLVIYGTQHIKKWGITLTVCLIEDDYVSTKYPLAYFTFNCICTLINFVTLTVLYSFVGVRVCKRWRFRSTSVRSLSSVIDDDDDCPTETHSLKKKDNDKSPVNGRKDIPPSPGAIRMVFMQAASTLRKTTNSVSNKRVLRIGKTTFMLFLVTLVYILSFLPFLGIAIHRSVDPSASSNMKKSSEMAYHVFLRSYLFNCAINPVIYSFCNDLFRKECVDLFKRMFCCRKQ